MKSKYRKLFLIIFLLNLIFLIVPISFSKYKSDITGNITLNVTRPSFTVKFNANGGTGSMSDMIIYYNDSQNLTKNTYIKTDYNFIGWNTQADGSGTYYQDESDISTETITNNDTITLYAQWHNTSYLTNTTEYVHYSCSRHAETYTVPLTGNYVLEAWGAQGGSTPENLSASKPLEAQAGGKGGYTYGVVHLNSGDQIYTTVGCAGSTLYGIKGTTLAGGYNGGGSALSGGENSYQGSGGGATHFSLNQNFGELKNFSSNQNAILLVAGGGGGSYSNAESSYYSIGGSGGGTLGGAAKVYYDTRYRHNALESSNNNLYYQGLTIPGGTQTLQTGSNYYYGTFGKGADAEDTISSTDAGAGGGWYGGNRLSKTTLDGGMAGSGGSGHINSIALSQGNTYSGNINIPSHDGTSYINGNIGDGYARISFINPTYIISFNANGGTGAMNDMNFIYGTAQNLTNNGFTRENYQFNGWNTQADGSGTSYSNQQEVNNLTLTDGDVITLYAQWIPPVTYFQLPPDWSGSTVNIYFFNSSNNSINSGWPGTATTLVDSTKNIYSHTLTDSEMASYDRVIFTNGNNMDSGSNLNTSARQTIDVTLTSDLYNKIFVPEVYTGEGTRVFFRGGTSYTPYGYYWNSDGNNGGWPGTELTDKISSRDYIAIVPSQFTKMIFNKGTGGSGNQTADLDVPAHQDLTYNLSSGPCRVYYHGNWYDYNSWQSTNYNTWYTNQKPLFEAAQTALGY